MKKWRGPVIERLAMLALCAALGCGGGGQAVTDTESPAGTTSTGSGSDSDSDSDSGLAVGKGDSGGATAEPANCTTGYSEFERAWSVWFETELEDAEAASVVTAEWIKQLPMKAELEEMAQVAEDLRYEPGFDLWIVALNATEEAIELCGEGAANPGA